ncbi:single-stranded DNA-binding protein [Tepidibacter mesophilus]|uniref:single-stranded DNA-binding protein n=1 Tax=Tepidibacter mesophilus TaxID=655607 RepID=UPI000C079EDF|nr:single-stranded DNA-binding protein [Tepidibacter mesophilus]
MNCTVLTNARIARDPELKFLPNGTPKLILTVAKGRGYKKDDKEVTDFLRVEQLSKGAEKLINLLYKGQRINIKGSYHRDTWKDENDDWKERNYIQADMYGGIEIVDWKNDEKSFEPVGLDTGGFQALDDDDDIPF